MYQIAETSSTDFAKLGMSAGTACTGCYNSLRNLRGNPPHVNRTS